MASEETKIAKCFNVDCNNEELVVMDLGGGEHVAVSCGECGQYSIAVSVAGRHPLDAEQDAIAAHNAFCADIDRGKQLDQMLTLFKLNPKRLAFADTMQGELWIEIVVAYIRLLEKRGELAAEAIRLLGSNVANQMNSTALYTHVKEMTTTDAILQYNRDIDTFLDNPAVAEIIKEQKEADDGND